jgi:predicted transport protein
MWYCPKCKRGFTRKNQRHACGIGNRSEVPRNRPESLVLLYAALEDFAKSLGKVEIVTRERYVLFRSSKIFTDVVVMKDALRVAIHLGRKIEHPIYFKIGTDRKHVTHVAKITTRKQFSALKPHLREAYEFSLSQDRKSA